MLSSDRHVSLARSKLVANASRVLHFLLLSSLLIIVTEVILHSRSLAETQPTKLKISHWLPPSHPLQQAAETWINDIEVKSGHTISGSIFPAELRGIAAQHYEMAVQGISDVSFVSPGYGDGNQFPIIAAANQPFLYKDGESGSEAVDAWYRKYAGQELKNVHYCFSFIHEPGTLHSRVPVVLPTQLKGLNVRQPNATIAQLIALENGTPIERSAPDSRHLFEQGGADAIFFPWHSLKLFGIDRFTKYDIDAQMYSSVFLWVLYPKVYDTMDSWQQRIIDDHCSPQWARIFASAWARFEREGKLELEGDASRFSIKLGKEQLAAWKGASTTLHRKWAQQVSAMGGDADSIWHELESSLDQHGARYQ
jgi:TRAP-type transport system periplasmic protein